MNRLFSLGIDIGSTTVKVVVFDDDNNIVYKNYKRHLSSIKNTVLDTLLDVQSILEGREITVAITGSCGIDMAKRLKIDFIQEVIASTEAIKYFYPETDVVIELGGEDAKVTYLTDGINQRMNGICAGGTGAFIDQMAYLLQTDSSGLNELAKNYDTIYKIASRCGVFAKTDIQPLLNDGAKKENIAMSIFNAVAIQTVSALACGREIKGKVAFLGGPLYFLSELRYAFKRVLNLDEEDIIFPKDAQLYVCMGASLISKKGSKVNLESLIDKIKNLDKEGINKISKLEPLFKDKNEYEIFLKRHNKKDIGYKDIEKVVGNCYLGIDAGSTTTKVVLIDEEKNILYSHYSSNNGRPLDTVKEVLIDIYSKLPKKANICYSTVTGYGEGLIKKALGIDFGEIETIAHYKGAKYFNDKVDFILDIGGQDMKCLKIKDGVIDNIILNEACSSGCGSFLENFSESLSIDIKEFAKIGTLSKLPVDLGSRCTVFMNSKVKQAQKEGASIADISAGLSYSIIKNALYKVIKENNFDNLGSNIVVQGGTFNNDSVLRSFEKIINKEVIRPSIAGLMGAFGCALISMDMHNGSNKSTLLNLDKVKNIEVSSKTSRCGGCSNNCLLTINKFYDELFISGNRCERGEALYNDNKIKENKINLYKYKYNRIFNYKPLEKSKAFRGEIGIPRVLNIYENYPFWHTFFTNMGFRVVLSKRSSKDLYEKGISSITSDTICYPAKMVHGHIKDLIEKDIKYIFYPCVVNEKKEDERCDNNYNCPIVISYSEVIKNNIDEIKNINYINPFISLNNREKLIKNLYEELFKYFNISKTEVEKSLDKAYIEQERYRKDIEIEGEKALKEIYDKNEKGIVLCGRPYHIDPEINHGIPELINSLGINVLSEDSICHLSKINKSLRVVDQWVYHHRMYKAASFVKESSNLELVQLNSFGCGIDAITIDQVKEILNEKSKIHTVIKIDEGNNLGAAKIRIRSLKAAIEERKNNKYIENDHIEYKKGRINKKHTILVPQMSPIHFQFFKETVNLSGYNLVILENIKREIIDEGLKYVSNDACYPAIIVIGQIIEALKTGKYDLNNTSVAITQTGGGCRATNYIGFLRKALYDSGYKDIPVISLSVNGIEKNGLSKHITLSMANRLLMSCIYGDLLMKVLYRTRPYEKYINSANKLYNKWVCICKESLKKASILEFKRNIKSIIYDFDNLELIDTKKPKVGLVGEILVKFHPLANNYLVDIIESEGGEAVVPELSNFLLSCCLNAEYKFKYLEGKWINKELGNLFINTMNIYQSTYNKELMKSKRFIPPKNIRTISKYTENVISLGNQTGEGWLLTGEMLELLEDDIKNIICMQPFGCLPNHITGKGQIKKIKEMYKDANIIAIDYDSSASEINQINRIKLMLSTALKNNF